MINFSDLVEADFSVPAALRTDWNEENLRKLFAAMKKNIPTRYRTCSYYTTLLVVDWTKVAFPPFSPEACKGKWTDIMKKVNDMCLLFLLSSYIFIGLC